MKNFIRLLAIFSTFHCIADGFQDWNSIFQESQIEFGYAAGKYISIDKNYAEIGLFVPFSLTDCDFSFIDARGYRFSNGKWASSLGFGIRNNISECSAIGVNAYYDYRRGESRNNFNQIGLGFEWLNCCWDFRINGYLPISRKVQTSQFCSFNQLGDGFFATRRRIEYAYKGFDAEIGVPLMCYGDFNLYGAVGPYYYSRTHRHHFIGGQGRLELNWKSILSFQVRISHDKVYSTHVQGLIQISLPLDFLCSGFCGNNRCCQDFINQRVRRNGIILTDHCCNWKWNWDDSSSEEDLSSEQ